MSRQSASSVDFTVSHSQFHLAAVIRMLVSGYPAVGQDPPHTLVEHGRSFEDGGILYALKYARGFSDVTALSSG